MTFCSQASASSFSASPHPGGHHGLLVETGPGRVRHDRLAAQQRADQLVHLAAVPDEGQALPIGQLAERGVEFELGQHHVPLVGDHLGRVMGRRTGFRQAHRTGQTDPADDETRVQ